MPKQKSLSGQGLRPDHARATATRSRRSRPAGRPRRRRSTTRPRRARRQGARRAPRPTRAARRPARTLRPARPAPLRAGSATGAPRTPARPTPRTAASASTRCRTARTTAERQGADGRGSSAQVDDLLGKGMPGYETFKSYFSGVLQFDSKTMDTRAAPQGLQGRRRHDHRRGRPDRSRASPPTSTSRSRPAGRGAHTIDPKPILDGWKLLEATAIYRAAGKNPFDRPGDRRPGPARVEVASCQRQVLADPRARDLLLRPRGHRAPARSTAASWRCSSTSSPAATGSRSRRSSAATAS